MIILKIIGKLIKILHSGPEPRQIALGIALGMILGFSPSFSIFSLIVIILILFLDINISSAILGWIVFSIPAYLLDSQFHDIGYALLVDSGSIRSIWTTIYNLPLMPYSNFNNTVTLGSLIISIVIFYPVYFLSNLGVIKYRLNIAEKFQKLKIVKIVKGSKPYIYYQKLQNFGD